MCGFAGIFDPHAIFNSEILVKYTINMASELIHRGPDDQGNWYNEIIALSHRRLSIQDLSKAGAQPMQSKCDRYVIAFNGEIYNHNELRNEIKKLKKIEFTSRSDTESLLESIAFWGLEKTLRKANGMFAFALWDKKLKLLYLVRDRFGEKPIYYGWLNQSLVFASELKAIKKNPIFKKVINKEATVKFLNKGYIPSPLSIYEGIYKVEPGTFITIDCNLPRNPPTKPLTPGSKYGSINIKRFFYIDKLISKKNTFNNEKKCVAKLEKKITDSLELQSKADVSIGVLLSGGIDSSIISSLLQKNSNKQINTITLGFNQNQYDESVKALKISRILGTNHEQYQVNDNDIINLIPKLPHIYDEPFADPSQIPSSIICAFSSQKYKVLLSGDGGDEIFGGYPRYSLALRQYKLLRLLDYKIREEIGNYGLNLLRNDLFNSLMYSSRKGTKNKILVILLNKLNKLFYRLQNSKSIYDINTDMNRIWQTKESFRDEVDIRIKSHEDIYELRKSLMTSDIKEYLPDDLICKMERASMHNSVELRMPFLDSKVTAFSLSLSTKLSYKSNQPKYLLKKILEKYLPKDLVYSPKKGFKVPLGQMLKTTLIDWANDLIDSYDLEEETNISKNTIQKLWVQHLSGNYDWSNKIWTILMYISWRKENL